MRLLEGILATLNSTKIRVWHLIVAFAATSFVGWLVAQHDRQQAYLADRVVHLTEASSNFENRVSAYMTSGEAFVLNDEQLALLIVDIETQISALMRIKPALRNADQKSLAERYTRALAEVRDILRSGLGPGNTGRFGIAAIELTQARDALLDSLT